MLLTRLTSALLVLLMASTPVYAGEFNYPVTERSDHMDDYHGTQVADPYRWLEQDVREADAVSNWVAEENAVTFEYLHKLPGRESIRARLEALWDYEKFTPPWKTGGRYFFHKNDGLQNQYVLYTMSSLDQEPRVLIDPNNWSEDGTVALSGIAVSPDGKHLAYGIQDGGSDWRTWRVMEIDSGKLLGEQIEWVKFSAATWTRDSKGFFYSRYSQPAEGQQFQSLNMNQKLYYHLVGTSQDQDVLVFEAPEHPEWGFGSSVTEDGRYLVITVWKGTDSRYRVYYRDLNELLAAPVALVDNFDHEYAFIGNSGSTFYFMTNLDAGLRRVVATDVAMAGKREWREIVPQKKATLVDVNLVNNRLLTRYLEDAKTRVSVHELDGTFVQDIELPGLGTANGFNGEADDTETFYSFSSFATPPGTYRLDLKTGKSSPLQQAKIDFDPEDYTVSQVFYESSDGTRVPMFIAHRTDVKPDRANPTLLYGYGGFDISLTPSFSISNLAWMEMGGVYAQPSLRGGGEYGEAWHKAGTRLQKQNVFDDFIAAAQWLIDNGWTSREKLAIRGGSNGGLLVGAVMTQRPELFAAALPAVGVMDMLRFHQFTAGRFWVDDYGSADDPEEFKALLAYSPYHNLKPGTEYPATLITTADLDDRVVPGHSFKFAAALQHANAGNKPVLIRIETRAGHGAGKPTSKRIEEAADLWAFLAENLGMN